MIETFFVRIQLQKIQQLFNLAENVKWGGFHQDSWVQAHDKKWVWNSTFWNGKQYKSQSTIEQPKARKENEIVFSFNTLSTKQLNKLYQLNMFNDILLFHSLYFFFFLYI